MFLFFEPSSIRMKFFITLGDTAFNHLPIIFAVASPVVLAKREEKGSAALSGVLRFYRLTLSPS